MSATDPSSQIDQQLQHGLEALKRKQYDAAIAAFTAVLGHQSGTTQPLKAQLKAQMGLVKAYRDIGNLPAAQNLCRSLSQSPSRQVRDWARQTWDTLGQAPAIETGFTPLAAGSLPSATGNRNAPARTGFQPLSPNARPQPQSGFVPLEKQETKKETEEDAIAPPSPQVPPQQSAPEIEPSAPPGSPDLEPSGVSMFHADYLNQPISRPVVPPHQPGSPGTEVSPAPPPPEAGKPTSTPVAPVDPGEPGEPDSVGGPTALVWQDCSRLNQPRKLGKVKREKLWVVLGLTVWGLMWLLRRLIREAPQTLVGWIAFLRLPPPYNLSYQIYSRALPISLGLVVLLVLAGPWLWDVLLKAAYQQKSYSTRQLKAVSPEAASLLLRVCRQRGWVMPELRLVPTAVPLCFSYGGLPRFARIVISQGTLDHLEPDEIAALYAYEMGQVGQIDWALLSAYGLVLQALYQGYWQLGRLVEYFQLPIPRYSAAVGANGLYALYWLLRKLPLWLGRSRTIYCDRSATELTGNPNGLIRALAQLAAGQAKAITTQGSTPPVLESLDLLSPIDLPTALSFGSLSPQIPLATRLTWDLQNPYRDWLAINHPHPPLGMRLYILSRYGQYWQVGSAIPWGGLSPKPATATQGKALAYWRPLLLLAGPYSGLGLGLGAGLGLWGLGAIATAIDWPPLDWLMWLQGDSSVMQAALYMGVGIGLLVRINPFFPDFKAEWMQINPPLAHLIDNPNWTPKDSITVRLNGKLLGRPGLHNWLGQDLMLQTPQGLIKLHFLSSLGPLGNLFHRLPPHLLIGQSVTVTGWFRRGVTPWIDADQLRTADGSLAQSGHPFWSTLVSFSAITLALWTILQGSP